MKKDLQERLANTETHVINIYHHVKRIEKLLEAQNGRVRENEQAIALWRGVSLAALGMASILSVIAAFII